MSKLSIGVCIFDDPRTPQGGFASLDGRESTYISGYHELSQDTLWVTNLEFPVFKELNLLRLKYLAQAQYFRTSIRLLQGELGLSDGRHSAQVLSTIFHRLVNLGFSYMGADHTQFNYRYHQALAQKLNIPGMLEMPQGIDPNMIQLMVDHATQENQAMAGVKRPDRSSPVPFLFPREAFGQWLFSRMYPVGNTYRSDGINKEYTVGTRDGKKTAVTEPFFRKISSYAETYSRAMFFRISMISQEASHRAFASFGSGSKEQRVWVSWPELVELAEYSVMTVFESISTEAGSIKDYLPSFTGGSGFGFSEGLFFENLYAALASPVNGSNTALGSWLRAYDRMACQRAAEIFHRNGLTVGSYSSGRVVLMLPQGQREKASKLALDNGMLPPLKEAPVDE